MSLNTGIVCLQPLPTLHTSFDDLKGGAAESARGDPGSAGPVSVSPESAAERIWRQDDYELGFEVAP